MAISDNIKELRRVYGITQKQLADIAGVSDKAVSTWELGTNEPRMGVIQKISDHFKIPKSVIIDGDINKIKTASQLNISEDAAAKLDVLLSVVDSMTSEEWGKLMEYAELLLRARKDHIEG